MTYDKWINNPLISTDIRPYSLHSCKISLHLPIFPNENDGQNFDGIRWTKMCNNCGVEKNVTHFNPKNQNKRDPFENQCKPCKFYRNNWGLTYADIEDMFRQQQNLCILCNREFLTQDLEPNSDLLELHRSRFHVDHDHRFDTDPAFADMGLKARKKLGIRGLAHSCCNRSMGAIEKCCDYNMARVIETMTHIRDTVSGRVEEWEDDFETAKAERLEARAARLEANRNVRPRNN